MFMFREQHNLDDVKKSIENMIVIKNKNVPVAFSIQSLIFFC